MLCQELIYYRHFTAYNIGMENKTYRRILRPSSKSFFLLGARGTGKSTWIKAHFPEAKTFDLLDEGLYQSLLKDPSLFAGTLHTLPAGSWVAVDEIQRLPQLLNEIHRFIENRKLRFLLCGSSARKLKKAGTNLLAGRALKRVMHPFVPEELGSDFSLEKALTHGTIPLIWQAESKSDTLAAYTQLYLKEEIQAEAVVRNLPGFARFLPIAALFHAQTLNVSNLAREAGVSRTTVHGYLQILEDTLMAFRLPAFEGRLRVRERKHPKFYWIDAGIVRALKGSFSPISREERGPLLEGWVANLLRIYAEQGPLFDALHYWAPAEARRTEVDFLLQKGSRFLALEVKSQERVDTESFLGLRAIRELKQIEKRVLVYTGKLAQRTPDGIDVFPVGDLLRRLETGTLWD